MAKTLLFALLLLNSFRVIAQHGSSASASVSVTIVSPIGASKQNELNFGSFKSEAQPGNIIIGADNNRQAVGGIVMNTTGSAGPAVFTVYGSAFDYMVTLPQECVVVRKDGTETMRLCSFDIQSYPGIGDPNNKEQFAIGAMLSVNAHQSPGVYLPASPLEVVISYN